MKKGRVASAGSVNMFRATASRLCTAWRSAVCGTSGGSTEGCCCSRSSATSHRPPADPHCAGPDLQSGGDELAGTGTRIGSADRARDDLRRRDHRDDGFDGLLRRLLATRAHDVVPPYAILQRFRPLGWRPSRGALVACRWSRRTRPSSWTALVRSGRDGSPCNARKIWNAERRPFQANRW